MKKKNKPGIFSRVSKGVDKVLGGKFARGVRGTFIDPLARTALTMPTTVVQSVQEAAPGGKTGFERVESPFGDVKRLRVGDNDNLTDEQRQQVATPGQALGMAAEVATSAPAGVAKGLVKPLAKATTKIDEALGVSKSLRGSAVKTMEDVLAPTKERLKAKAPKVAAELLDRGFVGTFKGLGKFAKKGLDEVGERYDEIGELKGKVPTAPVVQALRKGKSQYVIGGKVVNPRAVRAFDAVSELVEQFGDEMPAEAMRGLRRVWDEPVEKAGGYAGATLDDRHTLQAEKIGANAIRELLGKHDTTFADVNKVNNFFRNLEEILEATKKRKVGQTNLAKKSAVAWLGSKVGKVVGSATPFGADAGELAGAAVGFKAAEALTGALPQTVWAQGKNKLAEVISSGEYSIPRIAEFIKKSALAPVKWTDLNKFIENEGRLTDAEKEQLETEREQRIENLRQRFDAVEEVPTENDNVGSVDPEKEARIEALRQRFREAQAKSLQR